jgi:hypothetical protein
MFRRRRSEGDGYWSYPRARAGVIDIPAYFPKYNSQGALVIPVEGYPTGKVRQLQIELSTPPLNLVPFTLTTPCTCHDKKGPGHCLEQNRRRTFQDGGPMGSEGGHAQESTVESSPIAYNHLAFQLSHHGDTEATETH